MNSATPSPADRQPAEAAHDSEAVQTRKMLEEVLRQTLARDRAEDACADEMAALLQVAHEFRGLPLDMDPVASRLVLCVLRTQFRALNVPDEGWETIARNVARTLLEDPLSHERLRRMWRRLCEASP